MSAKAGNSKLGNYQNNEMKLGAWNLTHPKYFWMFAFEFVLLRNLYCSKERLDAAQNSQTKGFQRSDKSILQIGSQSKTQL